MISEVGNYEQERKKLPTNKIHFISLNHTVKILLKTCNYDFSKVTSFSSLPAILVNQPTKFHYVIQNVFLNV